MYSSRQPAAKGRKIFILVTIVAGLFIFGAMMTEAVHRRVEAIPYYARTYLNRLRPTPEMPDPPAVSAIAPQALLQARPTIAAISSEPNELSDFEGDGSNPVGRVVLVQPTPSVSVAPSAPQVTLTGFHHEWQTWNNCGPTTIAMNLSYYGGAETQAEAAQFLKPNKDDKNVNPEELAAYAREQGFAAITRMGGNLDLLKRLLSNGLPVIVETWAEPEDHGGMGHYRLLTGYNEAGGYFITQDSLNGPGLQVSMGQFDDFWRVFNRKYVLIYHPDQAELVQIILGLHMLDQPMYEQALLTAQNEAKTDPANAYAWFNMGTSYAHLGEARLAASAFDQARRLGLPFRMLWYQFEIFEVYLAVGRFQDVIDLGTATLQATGGLEEIYYYRGLARRAVGQAEAAVADFQAALKYNPHFALAAKALQSP